MQAPITDINQLDMDATYTVADYLSWQFDELVQLIKGKVFRMSPSPRDLHAKLSLELILHVGNQVKGHPCTLRHAPYDVYLTSKEKKATVLIPDILIVCDPSKIQSKGCVGAPDWVCEIVSPGSFKIDTVYKKEAYAEAGVPEYMIVHPGDQVAEVYKLNQNGMYGEPDIYTKMGQEWEISSVPGVTISYSAIFGEEQ
jgi:Uma2 family endonuclease